jgi:hypothetical protein
MKYLKNIDQFLMDENFIGRTIIDIFEHAAEILNYFRLNQYQKTKDGLRNALSDWMDDEFYTMNDRTKIEPFLDKFIKFI